MKGKLENIAKKFFISFFLEIYKKIKDNRPLYKGPWLVKRLVTYKSRFKRSKYSFQEIFIKSDKLFVMELFTPKINSFNLAGLDLVTLDFYFPFFVFLCGALMCFVAYNPKLISLAEKKMSPQFCQRLKTQKIFYVLCFVGGGLWSLQNWWLF